MKDIKAARRHLNRVDRHLGKAIKKIKLENRKLDRSSPYVRLASAIISQQISTAAARAIWGRFIALFGKNDEINFEKLLAMPVETLRGAGVSPQKIGYLKDLAAKVVANTVPAPAKLKKMSDEEIVEALLPIKGVGVWTIQMILIFYYRRPDIWPIRDLGVKKGFMKVHGKSKLPSETALEKFGNKFKPYRSYAALYYWRSLDN